MNKSELKTGMYVEDRVGNKMRFVEKYFVEKGLGIIKHGAYKDDLTEADGNTGFDIMKVFDTNRKLIWEREKLENKQAEKIKQALELLKKECSSNKDCEQCKILDILGLIACPCDSDTFPEDWEIEGEK